MKLEDQIRKSIFNYPGLYRCHTLEASRLRVLNQLFLVNGNGLHWLDGYLTEYDDNKYLPYGVQSFGELPEDFFTRHIPWKTENGVDLGDQRAADYFAPYPPC